MNLATQVREEKLAKLLEAEGYDGINDLAGGRGWRQRIASNLHRARLRLRH